MTTSGQSNFTWLFLGLILYLLSGPIVGEIFPSSVVGPDLLLQLGFNAMLLVSVWSIRRGQPYTRMGWGLTIGVLVLSPLSYISDSPLILHTMYILFMLFIFISLRLCIEEVVYGGDVDVNRLIGAACVYLLMGVAWGVILYYLEVLVPGSFDGLPEGADDETIHAFLYYSFVTLTTLGYGDIVPVSPLAQTLSYLEAVSGTIYLAVLGRRACWGALRQ